MMKRALFVVTVAVAAAVATMPIVKAGSTTAVVWPGSLNGWSYTNFGSVASQTFVLGPGIPPLGTGSAAFSHAFSSDYDNGGALHTANLNGVYLRDITELSYSTYQEGADALLYQPPYVEVFLDLDDDGVADDGIGFEPSWQNGGRFMVSSLQGTGLSAANTINVVQNGLNVTGAGVAANEWWAWDLLVGSWWARYGGALSVGIGPTDRLGSFECNQFVGGCATIAGIVERYPNARIVSQQPGPSSTGGFRLQYGFGGNSDQYIGHVDKLVVGVAGRDTVTYDFERGPSNKNDCKNGGWQGFSRNQGQCVSYFESNRPPR
jgi:hypothetical protein